MKAIMGMITMYSGQVFFEGEDITKVPPHERTMLGIGYMPQTGNIFSKLSVEDNLRMASYIMADKDLVADKREMVMNLFPVLKGFLKRDAGTLSGGERQMLAESMVLMRDPKVMLVDEPTAGLMPKLVTDVLKKLEEMAEATGLPIIIVEQRARRALEIGDQAYLMRGGVFTFEGSAEELLNHPLLNEMYLGAIEVRDLKTIRE
jgi:branched-chain amino acid transport system ATP-binding protein